MTPTKEEILETAQRKGVFCVPLNYSADATRKRCQALVREGKLRHDPNWRKYGFCADWFLLAQNEGRG